MASIRDIKRRKESVSSTGQITKAMKLVATVKLQKAREKADRAKPYFRYMYQTVQSILSKKENVHHPYLDGMKSKRKAVLLITSNRGLAGGYNNNVAKLVLENEEFDRTDTDIYTVGIKGREIMKEKGYKVVQDYSEVMNEPLFSDAQHVGTTLLSQYEDGKVGEIYLAYTVFKNTVVQKPTLIKLLPVQKQAFADGEEQSAHASMTFEPSPEETLRLIIPKYINSMIYGALMESLASENGARMSAMDSATNNANELIGKLSLQYNRARQGNITQELTEIVAGADAISS